MYRALPRNCVAINKPLGQGQLGFCAQECSLEMWAKVCFEVCVYRWAHTIISWCKLINKESYNHSIRSQTIAGEFCIHKLIEFSIYGWQW